MKLGWTSQKKGQNDEPIISWGLYLVVEAVEPPYPQTYWSFRSFGTIPTRAWNQTWNHQPDSNLWLGKQHQTLIFSQLSFPWGGGWGQGGPTQSHTCQEDSDWMLLVSMGQTKWEWYGRVTYTNMPKHAKTGLHGRSCSCHFLTFIRLAQWVVATYIRPICQDTIAAWALGPVPILKIDENSPLKVVVPSEFIVPHIGWTWNKWIK